MNHLNFDWSMCWQNKDKLQSKSMDWFLYGNDLRHEKVKESLTILDLKLNYSGIINTVTCRVSNYREK